MGGVLEALYELLLRAGRVDSTAVQPYILVFGGGCFVIALLVLVLDIYVFVVRGRSFLGYHHGFKRSILAGMLIPTAAGIVGMIGLGVDVIQLESSLLRNGEGSLADPDDGFDGFARRRWQGTG